MAPQRCGTNSGGAQPAHGRFTTLVRVQRTLAALCGEGHMMALAAPSGEGHITASFDITKTRSKV